MKCGQESGGPGEGAGGWLNHTQRSEDSLLWGCCTPVTPPGPTQNGKHASAETW